MPTRITSETSCVSNSCVVREAEATGPKPHSCTRSAGNPVSASRPAITASSPAVGMRIRGADIGQNDWRNKARPCQSQTAHHSDGQQQQNHITRWICVIPRKIPPLVPRLSAARALARNHQADGRSFGRFGNPWLSGGLNRIAISSRTQKFSHFLSQPFCLLHRAKPRFL